MSGDMTGQMLQEGHASRAGDTPWNREHMDLPCQHAAKFRHLLHKRLQVLVHLLSLTLQLSNGVLSSFEALLCTLQGFAGVCLLLCDGCKLVCFV